MNVENQKLFEQEVEKPVLEGLAVLAKIIAREIENENLKARKQWFINPRKEEENNEE